MIKDNQGRCEYCGTIVPRRADGTLVPHKFETKAGHGHKKKVLLCKGGKS